MQHVYLENIQIQKVTCPMGRYRYLLKNVGLLTLSNFATKLLSFFMVPLYTSVLTTAEYGTYDVFSTTVSVLLPILTLNIQEGVLRYALDKDYDRHALVTLGLRWTLGGSAVVAAGLLVAIWSGLFTMGPVYALYFFLMFLSQALSGLVLFYVRGIDRITDLSVSSVIASAVIISLNLLFLLVFRWGLDGYFLANIIGPLMQVAYLMVRTRMMGDARPTGHFKKESRQLVAYSSPLIANSIAWWVTSVSDRYFVIFFCGLAANGIYSVASKIPSILTVFQTIFSQAWTLSVVKDYDPEDKDGFFANTYAAYSCVLTIVCSAIIVADKVLARFLYANDFYAAWQYVPWLTMSIIFGALSNYVGGFFTAVKDSKGFAKSSVAGAVTNVLLNFVLVPTMGPMGAAISTAICYVEVWILRLRRSRRYIRLRINLKRDIAAYVLLGAQSIALICIADEAFMYATVIGLFVAIALLYTKEIACVVKKVLNRRHGVER